MTGQVAGKWRKLHNEEFHDVYSSPSIIRIMKARRMRWARHVARMGRGGTCIGCLLERQREEGHWEGQGVGAENKYPTHLKMAM
jgi:hypothetical protein